MINKMMLVNDGLIGSVLKLNNNKKWQNKLWIDVGRATAGCATKERL